MSQVTKTILIVVKQQGLDQVGTAVKGLTTTSNAATKATNGLGSAFQKGQGDALKLRTGVTNLDKAEIKAAKSTDNFGKSADTAGKKTSGLAAKFQGNKGAIFAFTGIFAAGMEAVGMFGMYQMAADKVTQAQERVNLLTEAGAQGTAEYRRAVDDVAEAKRGYNFILRNVMMSFGDLVPFALLAVNAILKMKDTVTSSKPALDAASQATTGLGNAASATSSGGLRGLFNSLGQAVTGTKNLDTGLKTANTTTGTFNNALGNLQTGFTNTNRRVEDATRLIGTGNAGLVGGVSGLTTNIDKNTKMSTRFQDAFKKIGESIKNLPNTFKNIGSSIASFFTHFGTNITKFGGALKTAGSAALHFGKTLAMAMLSNPITAVIAGISAAVLALATDFGGIRTAANNFGVALGNAIPPAKGILQAIGDAANGALDAVAGFLGLQKEVKNTGTAATAAATQFEPLKNAIVSTVQISGTIGTLRLEIDKLKYGVDLMTRDNVQGLNSFRTAVENALTSTQKQSPAVRKVLQELDDTIVKVSADGYDLSKAKTELNAVLNKLQVALIGTENAALKEAGALINSAKSSKELNTITGGLISSEAELAGQVALVRAELKLEDQAMGQSTKSREQNRKAVEGWLNDMGMAKTATDAQIASLLKIAPALGTVGQHIDLTGGKVVDLGNALISMAATQEDVKAKALDLWGKMAAGINSVGKDAIPIIENALVILKDLHPEVAAEVEKLYQGWQENTVETAEGIFIINEAEEETKEKVKDTTQEIANKAKELGIYNDIQKLSIQDQKTAIQITEDQNKANNTARLTLQQLATARGLEIKNIGLSNRALFNLIQSTDLEKNSKDDVFAATAKLIDARQQEAKAADLETQAAELFLEVMDKTAPVVGMTGKGLMQLAQTYDETAKASSIAADEVGNWVATLEKEKAVDEATIETLMDLADQHGLEIPDAIRNGGIPAIQEYIKSMLGLGNAAQEMAEAAAKAFDDLSKKGQDAVGNLIDEHILAGKAKKIIKELENVGIAADSMAAKQRILAISVDDTDFTNKIEGLSEIALKEFGQMAGLSKDQASEVVHAFGTQMESEFGAISPGIGDAASKIWEYIKATSPAEATGDQLLASFANAMKNPALVTQALNGSLVIPTKKTAEEAKKEAAAGGKGINQSVADALNSGKAVIQNATIASIKDPITGEIKQIPVAAGNGLNPLPGIFNQSFLDASVQGSTQLQNLVTAVQQKMSIMSTSVDTYSTSMNVNFVTAIQNMAIPLLPFGEALYSLQQIFSNLSANIATYTTSMTANINNWLIETSNGFVDYDIIIKAVQGALSNLSTNTATYASSMTTNTTNWINTANTGFKNYQTTIKTTQGSLSTLSTSTATYSTSMTNNINKFATGAGTSFSKVASSAKTAQGQLSNMSTSVATYMSSMSSKVSSFASAASSAFSKVGSQAAAATQKVKALASAINSLKSKSINIHVGLTGPGARFMRHGGAFISADPTGFAQGGMSFINSKPRKIGGVNISEFGKPELVTVTPLSNPSDPTDKNMNLGMSIPRPQPIPSALGANPLGNRGGAGGGQPITVTGNLNITIKTQNGKVLAQEVQPYLFEGFSGVT